MFLAQPLEFVKNIDHFGSAAQCLNAAFLFVAAFEFWLVFPNKFFANYPKKKNPSSELKTVLKNPKSKVIN